MSNLVKQLYSLRNLDTKAITIVGGDSFTFKQIFGYADQIGYYLTKQALGENDRILLLIEPGLQAVCTTLACLKLGISIILIDPDSTGQDAFLQKIKTAQPTHIILDYRLRILADHPIARFILNKAGRNIPYIPNLKSYPTTLNKKIPLMGKALPDPNPALLRNRVMDVDISNDKDALIVFTSGTTSEPKAVVHSHKSLKLSLDILKSLVKHPQPKLYTNQIYFLLFAMALKAEVVFDPKTFKAKRFVDNSLKFKPNMTFAPPGELIDVIRFCKSTSQEFPNTYQHILLGSAPVTKGFLKKLYGSSKKHFKTTCLYGMTEILPISHVDGESKLKREIDGDLLGKTVKGVHLHLDNESVLHVQAKHLCDRYLNGDKHTKISTGDMVTINDKKEIILRGRKKDMILRGSFNIYPSLYEPIIESIPGVDAASLIGLYDESIEDERVFLVVESNKRLNKNSIIKKLKSGKYSIDLQALPDEVVFMKMPRSGRQKKINKAILRQKLQQL